jgi:hypothetical protein
MKGCRHFVSRNERIISDYRAVKDLDSGPGIGYAAVAE